MSDTSNKKKLGHPEPLSEDKYKRKEASKEECIAELRRIAEAEPEMIITRNYFRNVSSLAESAWTAHFGTFQEFKRQADIIPSRHAAKIEREIAKHASVETYKAVMADKEGWEQKFVRPVKNRFQTVMICSDTHDIECDPFWYRVFLDTVKRVRPEKVILNGDIFDLYEFGKYAQDPREVKILERIKWVHQFLEDIRNAHSDTELVFVEGNHEYRLFRHLAEQTPALKIVLSDLHGMTIPDLLGLQKYEVNFIGRADLGAFTQRDIKQEIGRNYWVWDNIMIAHHFPEGKHLGMPGVNGHHHRHESWQMYSPLFGAYEWHQMGAGHIRSAEYCAGEKWGNGFMLAHADTHTRKTQFEYIQLLDHCVVGGKWFTRKDSEIVTLL